MSPFFVITYVLEALCLLVVYSTIAVYHPFSLREFHVNVRLPHEMRGVNVKDASVVNWKGLELIY